MGVATPDTSRSVPNSPGRVAKFTKKFDKPMVPAPIKPVSKEKPILGNTSQTADRPRKLVISNGNEALYSEIPADRIRANASSGSSEDIYDDVLVDKHTKSADKPEEYEEIYTEIPYNHVKAPANTNPKAPVMKAKGAKNKKEDIQNAIVRRKAPPVPTQQPPEDYYDDNIVPSKSNSSAVASRGPEVPQRNKPKGKKDLTIDLPPEMTSYHKQEEPSEYLVPTTPADIKHALATLDQVVNNAFGKTRLDFCVTLPFDYGHTYV